MEEAAFVGSSKETDDTAGGISSGSLCNGAESDKDIEKDVKGIAGSPGAVNISTSDTEPVLTSHKFSMSKNECWVLGAMPGSLVMLALTLLAPKSQAVKSKVLPLSPHQITEAMPPADIAVDDAAGA